jgi:hypothetical protein
MNLSAQLLDSFDRCPRRYALESTHEPRSISTIGLLYAGVEGGIVEPDGTFDAIRAITCRKDVDSGQLAAISAVRHIGFMAEVIALALTRRFGRFRPIAPVPLGKHQWQSNLFESKHGLHRILLVSALDDDTLRGYAHSWGTVGEIAALQKDVTLTAVVVGAQRAGRRHGHWSKCYQHPIQKSALRFARRKGGKGAGFTDGWREVWREATDIPAPVWVDKMEADEVMGELIRAHRIPFVAEDWRIKKAKADIFAILPRMEHASVDDPMRRSSCDSVFGACPWSALCWSPSPVELEELRHLYQPLPSSPLSR